MENYMENCMENYNEILESNTFTFPLDKESELSRGEAGYLLSGEPNRDALRPGLRTYLKMAPIQRSGACIYTDVLATALTPLNGPPVPRMGTLWGIQDSATLEYVICKGARVLAYAYHSPLTMEKAAYLLKQESFLGMFSQETLPGELIVIDAPDTAQCEKELAQAAQAPACCMLDNCSLTVAFRAIGMGDAAKLDYLQQLELLQSRRMLSPYHGKLDQYNCEISPFGRQCGLLMQNTLQPDGFVRRMVRVLLPAMDAFCQGVEYPRSRVMRVDDGQSLSQRLRRVQSCLPSSFRYQRQCMPGALERLREALSAPLELPETAGWLGQCVSERKKDGEKVSWLEGVSRLGCQITSYGAFRENEEYPASTRALAQALTRRAELPHPAGAVAPLSQRLQGGKASGSPLGSLTLAEYLQGMAILGHSSFVFWLYEHSPLPRALKAMGLHLGATLGDFCRAADKHYVASYRNELYYYLLVQPAAALAPHPDLVPRLKSSA